MALETWLVKVKKTISTSFDSVRATPRSTNTRAIIIKTSSDTLGILAFETAGLMSKLKHLWRSLSDHNIIRIRNECVSLQGLHKIVSNDESFLLSLACAEMLENLRLAGNSLSTLSKKCHDSVLGNFDHLLSDFSNTGHDPYNLALSCKEMETKIKKMDRYVTTTSALHRQIEELSLLENSLKKSLQCKEHEHKILVKQQKILWLRREIKYKKEKSLWIRNFDSVTLLLARLVFTVLGRIKLVFGVGYPNSLPRSLSASSSAVYPADNHPVVDSVVSETLIIKKLKDEDSKESLPCGFFEMNTKILRPPPSTLGAAALALHYANLIIVMEKMIRTPQLVGFDARDDLYGMLSQSIRWSLRLRLKGVGFSASDPVLAGEWRDALGKILGWLSPLAHNMIKWQSERSFEHQNMTPKTNVLLLQTLYFANQDKTEAAITELLVGLNYIWRFEREMNAKSLLDCSNVTRFLRLQSSS